MAILRRNKKSMKPCQIISPWMPLMDVRGVIELISENKNPKPICSGAFFLDACTEPCQETVHKLYIPEYTSL